MQQTGFHKIAEVEFKEHDNTIPKRQVRTPSENAKDREVRRRIDDYKESKALRELERIG